MSSEVNEMMSILNEHLAVKDEHGRVVLQVALIATVYFEKHYEGEVREAVISCCEDYFQQCARHLRWAYDPDTVYIHPFGKGNPFDPRAWIRDNGEDEPLEMIYHGAVHKEGASAFSVEAFSSERRPYETLGYFRVSFPLLWFAERTETLPGVLLRICRKLKPVSGFGGIGVNESPIDGISSTWAPVVYAWAQHFPGLEVYSPISDELSLPDGREGKGGIRGVNWLTVVGDRWLAELGGAEKVTSDLTVLDSRFIIHRFDGGVLIQAGPHPELGNAELNVWPELYVKLSQYLKPIRITKHQGLQMGGPGERFDFERSNAWLRRFDNR